MKLDSLESMMTEAGPSSVCTALIVDDDPGTRRLISLLLQQEGIRGIEVGTGEEAIEIIRAGRADLVILDVEMPGMGGMKTLKEARKLKACPPIILITGHTSIDTVVEAVKNGACDFIPKPFENRELARKVAQALSQRRVSEIRRGQPSAAREDSDLTTVMGPSQAIGRLIQQITRVAPTDFTVVIQGETGTGKELVARALHRHSRRASGPFVPVDCGAIPASLIESELFGHERGAFTGADRPRVGKFEAAASGTLFLDEVQNLPLNVQGNFLRALQERVVYRVGGSTPIRIDIRVVAASNRNLAQLVAAGQFREDLYHRLNEFGLAIPPLRERSEDICHIAQRFLRLTAEELGKERARFTPEAVDSLAAYSWPGNVRELRNVIRRAVLLADEDIQPEHLYLPSVSHKTPFPSPRTPTSDIALEGQSLKDIVRKQVAGIERDVLRKVLIQTRGNKAQAARLLQIDYKTIQTKVKEYGLSSLSSADGAAADEPPEA